ncbi:MAG: FAD-dependent monooxygenase [Desertifilum sp.]|nr:FAD-dependent monooxygenase [Desertifilum sp.]
MVEQITLIGAGPSGLLLAHYLLQQYPGYQVRIYERRRDPRQVEFSKARTYPLTLNTRGMDALQQVEGLAEAVRAIAPEMRGSVMHPQKGKPKARTRTQPLFALDRTQLAIALLDELTRRYSPPRLQVEFECECQTVNFASQTLTLQPAAVPQKTVSYEVLIGADGVNSQIRQQMSLQEGFECETQIATNAYKSLVVALENVPEWVDLRPGYLHSWQLATGGVVLMLDRGDGTMAGVLHFPREQRQVRDLGSVQEVLQFFQTYCPELGAVMGEADAEAFVQRPVSEVVSVRCNRYHQGNRVLLIGDAAHAVSPSLGQGCNAALEDVVVFGELLAEAQGNIREAIAQFTVRRQADAEALLELSNYAFPHQKRLLIEFFARQAIAKWLHSFWGGGFPPPMFQLLSDPMTPYSEILERYRGWIDRVKRVQVSGG